MGGGGAAGSRCLEEEGLRMGGGSIESEPKVREVFSEDVELGVL